MVLVWVALKYHPRPTFTRITVWSVSKTQIYLGGFIELTLREHLEDSQCCVGDWCYRSDEGEFLSCSSQTENLLLEWILGGLSICLCYEWFPVGVLNWRQPPPTRVTQAAFGDNCGHSSYSHRWEQSASGLYWVKVKDATIELAGFGQCSTERKARTMQSEMSLSVPDSGTMVWNLPPGHHGLALFLS